MRRTLVAFPLFFLLCTTVLAQEAPWRKPVGTWERQAGDAQVRLAIKGESLHLTFSSPDAVADVDADYGANKSGLAFGVITKIEKKGTEADFGEGQLFSFRFSLSKDGLKISEAKAPDADQLRQWLDGDYKAVQK